MTELDALRAENAGAAEVVRILDAHDHLIYSGRGVPAPEAIRDNARIRVEVRELAACVAQAEVERDAALAVIEHVRAIADDFVDDGYKPSRTIWSIKDALATSPPDALAEHDERVKAEARAETIQAVRGAAEFETPDPDDPSDEGTVYLTPSKLNALEHSIDGMDWVRITATDFAARLDEAAATALEDAAAWLINGEEAGIIAYEGPSNRAEVIAAYDRAIEDPACWLQERAATTRNPLEATNGVTP